MGSKLMATGDLRERVTIVRAGTRTRNARGDMVEAGMVETVRWARVTPAPGTERFASGERAADAPMRFVFRWAAGLVEVTDRLRFDGLTYDVKSVTPVGHREGIEVLAVARAESTL